MPIPAAYPKETLRKKDCRIRRKLHTKFRNQRYTKQILQK